MKNYIYLIAIIIAETIIGIAFLSGCQPKNQSEVAPTSDNSSSDSDINQMKVASNFRYATVEETSLNVTAILDNGEGVGGVVFEVFEENPQINPAATVIATGVTGTNGYYNEAITLATSVQSVYIRPKYLGLIDVVKGNVNGNSINVDLNPSKIPLNNLAGRNSSNQRTEATQVTYSFLGTWNNLGVPNYLISNNDVVDASFLADVNAALPERSKLPTVNPEYISQSTETDLILKDSADVWVTFVHEGAGWTNALGFYSYDISNPPTSRDQINKHTIIFPNVSYQGSGGGLVSGNKVKIGTFSKNTGIGWFLVANGWNGSGVGNGNYIQYSDPNFNLETVASLRPHMVLLNSEARNRVLIGFEDMGRQSGADNDFNDALFYVTANPYTAIQFSNVVALPSTQPNNDADGDGVYNVYDAYPNDATRAYDSFFPASNVFGTLCFEDLWPSKGDFDFNDMVLNYNFDQVMNGTNDVVEIKAKFVIKAIGASYRNGFGFQFPISNSKISNISGQKITGSLVELGGNNTELNQEKASVIVFDNPETIIQRVGGMYFNTEMAFAKGTSDTVTILITFSTPINTNDLGPAPFDPFIIVNQIRGTEVHLPDFAPTGLANITLFGQSDDNSIPTNSRYYKTSNTLPFALNIPLSFDYPKEKSQITASHVKFKSWAESSGTSFPDWYKNINGYRNASNVYNK